MSAHGGQSPFPAEGTTTAGGGPRNAFEALCALAAREGWCWKITCTTCGHMHFRYGFHQLSRGRHPDDPEWPVSSRARFRRGQRLPDPGPLPSCGSWPIEEQRTLAGILGQARLKRIADAASFPAWLGYLGLGLRYTEDAEREDRTLTRSWAPQLVAMLPADAWSARRLREMLASDDAQYLAWHHLESLAGDLGRHQMEGR